MATERCKASFSQKARCPQKGSLPPERDSPYYRGMNTKQRKKWALPWWGIGVMCGLVAACTPVTEEPRAVEDVTEPAPRTVRVAPQRVDMERYRGAVVLLDFWAPWSAPAQAERAALAAVHDHFAGTEDFAVVSFLVDTDEAQVTEMDSPWSVYSADAALLRSYSGGRAIPTKVLLNRQGQVVAVYAGAVDYPALKDEIAALLE